jgi:hypothetical protein
MRRALTTLTLLAASLASAPRANPAAADLSKVDRTIKKEPAYNGKPRYCLLVFGPKADPRVWLVLDGDTLHVDRNGNGDLTEAGEKVAAKKGAADQCYAFEAGELAVGGKTHKGLDVAVAPLKSLADNPNLMAMPHVAAAVKKDPAAMTARITLDVECESLRGGGVGGRVSYMLMLFDTAGVLQFGSRPADAPIVHLDGPLQVTFYGAKPTWRGGQSEDTILCVGTPGRGPGTFAMVKYEGTVPEGKHPKVEATYRPKDKEKQAFKELYELKERC